MMLVRLAGATEIPAARPARGEVPVTVESDVLAGGADEFDVVLIVAKAA